MKALILDFVESAGVSVMLAFEKHKGIIDIYRLDWIGMDGLYYSLLVPCNEMQVFSAARMCIGDVMSICPFSSNLKTFRTKKEWVAGRWKPDLPERMNSVLVEVLREKSMYFCSCCGYEVSGVAYAARPVLSVSVSYLFKKEYAGSFTAVPGSRSVIECSAGFAQFVQKVSRDLGCERWLLLETDRSVL